MNTDDLRNALGDEAAAQPPVSADLRAGIDRRVRRQRFRAAAVAAPMVAFVLVAALLLAPRGSNDTTLATADGSGGTAVATSTTVPAVEDPGTPTTVATGVPTPTDPTSVDCGTVTVSLSANDPIDTDRLDCFLKAFNGGGTGILTVVTNGPNGGAITEKLTSAPGHVFTVTGSGSISVDLPNLNFGGGGKDDPFPGSPAGTGGDCGTMTIDLPDLSSSIPPSSVGPMIGVGGPDRATMMCLFGAITNGGSSQTALVLRGTNGEAMTVTIDISAEHVLTISVDGSMTVKLPADLTVPEDILNAVPPGSLGMGQVVPGLGRAHKK